MEERLELAKLCSSRDWSKAIRVLDSLLSKTCLIQDICNRAFCYSQLELHKHVIKDCDKALKLDPALLQAYILKENERVSCLSEKLALEHKSENVYDKEIARVTAGCRVNDFVQLSLIKLLVF